MKKLCIFISALIIAICMCLVTNVYATEGEEIIEDEQVKEGARAVEEVASMDEYVTSAKAKVIEASEIKEVDNSNFKDKVQDIKLEILNGEYSLKEIETTYNLSYDLEGKIEGYPLSVGDKVNVQLIEDASGNITATIMEVNRAPYVIILSVLFILAIALVGGRKGIKAIISTIFSIVIVGFLLINPVLEGKSIILYTMITSILVIVGSFIINFGINKKIATASISSILGIVVASLVGMLFAKLTKMSGASEEIIQLSINMTNVSLNFRELIFGTIIISSLGAIMDVSYIIAQRLDELKMVTPEITWQDLFKNGMEYGRGCLGTVTNTLLFAYFGCSLAVVLLYMAGDLSLIELIDKESIAEKIIPALAGSFAVVITVPITAGLYSLFNKEQLIYRKTSENKVNGKRSLKI